MAKALGPFQDCTSNQVRSPSYGTSHINRTPYEYTSLTGEQAIAFGELSKPTGADIVATSVADAKALHPKYASISVEELSVEIGVCIVNRSSRLA